MKRILSFSILLAFLKAISASVVGGAEDVSVLKSQFIPQVAFQCGYRNRYMNKDGQWSTDKDYRAGCLTGKLDILKYCRKVYPDLDVTNIVESSHTYNVGEWCKIEGQPCKWRFWIKPYRCIVGEFESEALLVPEGCHFGHVDDRSQCKDFDYWNRTAQLECAKRLDVTKVQSFAMLEPCGLDMFSGVEFVCCPKNGVKKTVDLHVKVKLEQEKNISQDEDDSDEDDDSDEAVAIDTPTTTVKPLKKLQNVQQQSIVKKPATTNNGKVVADEEDDSDSDEEDQSSSNDDKNLDEQDPYFRVADPDNEHDRYREALERLEKKHRAKVAKVMKEWTDLETRYQDMSSKDPNHAKDFRNEMTTRFQRTVAALEEENRDERRQVEDVHQQRVNAALNERKRQAIKTFRDTLAQRKPSTQKVLRALEAYIRAEEKDRVHSLNRYRHLLKTDPDQAADMKADLLRKLRDVDLRINGTIEMLHDLPDLENKLKPIVLDFWKAFRKENTPDIDDDTLLLLDDSKNDKLLEIYRKQYQAEHNARKVQESKIAVDHIVTPSRIPDVKKNNVEKPKVNIDAKVIRPSQTKQPIVEKKQNPPPPSVIFNPIVDSVEDHQQQHGSQDSFIKKDTLQHHADVVEELTPTSYKSHYGYIVFGLAGVALLISMVFGVSFIRQRYIARRNGWIEVDACTPEERHVAAMQVNGYENPTYKYFDDKA